MLSDWWFQNCFSTHGGIQPSTAIVLKRVNNKTPVLKVKKQNMALELQSLMKLHEARCVFMSLCVLCICESNLTIHKLELLWLFPKGHWEHLRRIHYPALKTSNGCTLLNQRDSTGRQNNGLTCPFTWLNLQIFGQALLEWEITLWGVLKSPSKTVKWP